MVFDPLADDLGVLLSAIVGEGRGQQLLQSLLHGLLNVLDPVLDSVFAGDLLRKLDYFLLGGYQLDYIMDVYIHVALDWDDGLMDVELR